MSETSSTSTTVSSILRGMDNMPDDIAAEDDENNEGETAADATEPPQEQQQQPPPAARGSRASVSKISQKSDRSGSATRSETGDDLDNRVKSNETMPPIDRLQIIPDLNEKFMARPVQEIIRYVLDINLQGKTFDGEMVRGWCTTIADQINVEVKRIGFKRYKHVVQVVIAERSGAGVKSGFKCLWDKDTDGFTSDWFMNESLFCIVAVFGVYFY